MLILEPVDKNLVGIKMNQNLVQNEISHRKDADLDDCHVMGWVALAVSRERCGL